MDNAQIDQKAKELVQMVGDLGLVVSRDAGCERHCWILAVRTAAASILSNLAGEDRASIARFQNLEELERFLRWATENLAKSHSL